VLAGLDSGSAAKAARCLQHYYCILNHGHCIIVTCVVDGDVLNGLEAEEDEFDDDDDDDDDSSNSDNSEREFHTEFRKYKAHYYTDKLDFQRVTP